MGEPALSVLSSVALALNWKVRPVEVSLAATIPVLALTPVTVQQGNAA
jgi:hypothetical protein